MRMKKWVKRNKTIKFAAGLIALLIDKRRGKRSALEDEKFDPSASPID